MASEVEVVAVAMVVTEEAAVSVVATEEVGSSTVVLVAQVDAALLAVLAVAAGAGDREVLDSVAVAAAEGD